MYRICTLFVGKLHLGLLGLVRRNIYPRRRACKPFIYHVSIIQRKKGTAQNTVPMPSISPKMPHICKIEN